MQTSQRKKSASKEDQGQISKREKKAELTSTLLPNTIQLPPKTQRLDLTGPFNLFARPSQKLADHGGQNGQGMDQTRPTSVTPVSQKADKAKRENADTALSMTATTLRDSRTDKVRSLIRYIDTVLAEVATSPTKGRLSSRDRGNIGLVSEEEGLGDGLKVAKLSKLRQQAYLLLFRQIGAKLRQENKARQITQWLEEQLSRMCAESDNDYMAAVKALSAELSKPHVRDVDIEKISQAKPEDLEVFVSTLCNPKYFEL